MDRLLGVHRSDQPEGNQLVRPSVANLFHLADEFRALGLDVTTTIEGPAVTLSHAVDQTAFRIVQEALTNTLKHAGPTRTEVTLRYGPEQLRVEVRDHGRGVTASARTSADHDGRGLIGMQERVEIQRGSLKVGSCPDGGFLVVARLPVTPNGHPS